MSKITVLDQNTINQIAAGEVIERPAAVVKELAENAIDAGANAITVEIKEGGISFIRITDNGSGIEEEDMPLVFLRHSTSKIKTAEDLLHVSSLGFRGEALSSIAAIAQVELITKTAESFSGIHYFIAGGEEKSLEHIGCPNGTTFIVRNLFYNTPARRKFLKSPVTEAGYISDLMERLAVSHPDVSFKFINNTQIKLHTSGNSNLKDIIYNVYGRDITAHLLSVEGRNEQVSITGYIAKPIVSRGNRNYENYFINGRYIRSNLISKAIEEAYRPYSMSHRYPFTTLHLQIDSELIDVNVHPAKLEIRFKNGEELYQLIYQTLRNTLEGKELIPEVKLTEEKQQEVVKQHVPEPFEEKRKQEVDLKFKNSKGNSSSYNKTAFIESSIKNESFPENKISAEEKELIKETEIGKLHEIVTNAASLVKETSEYEVMQKQQSLNSMPGNQIGEEEPLVIKRPEQLSFISEEAKISHRIIGQIFSTYWIVEFGDKMFLIDQHAAHEKVLYEKTIKALKEKQYNSQLLDPPIILSLSMREEDALKKYDETLKKIGFEIEEFGGKEYAVRAVPSDLYGLAQDGILIELIDGLVDEVYNDTPEMILEKVASMSCKAAVKGNHRLSFEEARALIDQLLTLENPYHCPHGRPTIVSMSKYEIEKKFKRIV
jgi:DNA mismatch repair protein MutL